MTVIFSGHTNTTGDYIGMIQLVHNVSHPQDGNPGMLVPTLNGTQIAWTFDESYSLECADSTCYVCIILFIALKLNTELYHKYLCKAYG